MTQQMIKIRKIIGGLFLTFALLGIFFVTARLEADSITFGQAVESCILPLICGVIGYVVYYPYDK